MEIDMNHFLIFLKIKFILGYKKLKKKNTNFIKLPPPIFKSSLLCCDWLPSNIKTAEPVLKLF